MKLHIYIHIHIHRFYVDINGYIHIHILSCRACDRLMSTQRTIFDSSLSLPRSENACKQRIKTSVNDFITPGNHENVIFRTTPVDQFGSVMQNPLLYSARSSSSTPTSYYQSAPSFSIQLLSAGRNLFLLPNLDKLFHNLRQHSLSLFCEQHAGLTNMSFIACWCHHRH